MAIIIKQSGSQGPKGSTGWTPVISNVTDGSRIVQKVTDWFGGQGVKPAINQYLTATGFSNNIALAVDIRGYGDAGDNVIITANFVAKNHTCYVTNGASAVMTLPVITQANGFDARLISFTANLISVTMSSTQTLYRPSSRSVGATFEDVSFVQGAAPNATYIFPKGMFQIRAFNNGTSTSIYIF